jgi:S-adenosylmethionine-dependent methyltransferase
MKKVASGDRNFDDLVEHFAEKVAKSFKGKLRRRIIWRDLKAVLDINAVKPLKILDVGAGLGHFTVELAKNGHKVTYNDISSKMMTAAQASAKEHGLFNQIQWVNGAYQQLPSILPEQGFDLVLCHALIEWIQSPSELMRFIAQTLKPGGYVSICTYNQAGRVYRNLIRGNFNAVRNAPDKPSSGRGLTPTNPQSIEDIERLLTMNGLSIVQRSGIRVFSDYVQVKIGGNAIEEEVSRMELDMSQIEPYWRMGRYLHFCAQRH